MSAPPPAKVNESHISRFNAGKRFLRACDLLVRGKFLSVQLIINGYYPAGTIMREDGKPVEQPCISFEKRTKMMILSKTNQESLHMAVGSSIGADCIGKPIQIATRLIKFGPQQWLGIRILPPIGTKIRKRLSEMLGVPVEWHGQAADGTEIAYGPIKTLEDGDEPSVKDEPQS